jgi:hypothetical protein
MKRRLQKNVGKERAELMRDEEELNDGNREMKGMIEEE